MDWNGPNEISNFFCLCYECVCVLMRAQNHFADIYLYNSNNLLIPITEHSVWHEITNGVNHCSRAHTNVWENHNTFTANILTEFIVYYCCLVDNHLWFISEDNHRTQSVDFLLQTKHDSIEAAVFLCNYADWVETAEPLKWYRWRQKKN